jgi:hypothetical protein
MTRTDVAVVWALTPLIKWGLYVTSCHSTTRETNTDRARRVEQNVVIVAACIPTLRPFFHRAFKGERGTREIHSGQGSMVAATSFFRKRASQQPASVSEMPLSNVGDEYEGSSGSHKGDVDPSGPREGILRTVEVSMKWEEQRPRPERESMKDLRVVPVALREER